MNDDVLVGKIDDIQVVSEPKEEKTEACPECRGEPKFQPPRMKPSPFKDRKFMPPKKDYS